MTITSFLDNIPKRTLASLVLFLISAISSFVIFSALDATPSAQLTLSTPTPIAIPTRTAAELKDTQTANVLLLGYGGPGHSGSYLTDVILLIQFDFQHRALNFISIPRDLVVNHQGRSQKINGLMASSVSGNDLTTGFPSISQQVSQITGLPIDYVAGIDFVGLMRLVGEELGGITVNVQDTLSDPWYPIRGLENEPCGHTPEEIATLTATLSGFELQKQFPCRYEQIYFEPGPTQMEGSDALAYVRSRHSSSDFARARRQHQLLLGIKDKLLSLEALDNLPSFFRRLTDHVVTTIDYSIVEYMAPALKSVGPYTTNHIVLSTENVLIPSSQISAGLIPKQGIDAYTSIHQYISQELNKSQ